MYTWDTGDAEYGRGRDAECLQDVSGVVGVDDGDGALRVRTRADPHQRRQVLTLTLTNIVLVILQMESRYDLIWFFKVEICPYDKKIQMETVNHNMHIDQKGGQEN